MVFRMDGLHFSGATQILPSNTCTLEEARSAAAALASAVSGCLPQDALQKVSLPQDTFRFKEYRGPTKFLLCGVANALQQVMPAGWNLQNCRPPNLLLRRGCTGQRLVLDPTELTLCPDTSPDSQQLHFVWDTDTLESRYDFYISEDFTRLVFAADEGTEASDAVP